MSIARSIFAGVLALSGCTSTGAKKPTPTTSREAVTYECRDPSPEAAATGYRLTIEGRPGSPRVLSLTGRPEQPAPGDVAWIGTIPIVLGAPGHYRFIEQEGRVLVSVDGAPPRLVGLLISDPESLRTLDDEQRAGLRGLTVDAWTEPVAEQVARLELATLALSLPHSLARRGPPPSTLAPLPHQLRYLDVDLLALEEHSGSVGRGLALLSGLSQLRSLSIDSSTAFSLDDRPPEPIDLRALEGLTSLEHLRVRPMARPLEHIDALGRLTGLVTLDLSGIDTLDRIDFAASLPRLRRLTVPRTSVRSLEPLAGHPSLEVVDAQGSAVSELMSAPPPGLRRLNVLSTSIAAESATELLKRAPSVYLQHRYNQSLADRISCADRIRVRTGGLCHRDLEREKTLFEITDAAEFTAALPLLVIDESEPMGHCMCCGEPTIEFYRGDQFVTAVGFHHGRSLRWYGWPHDAKLTDPSGLCRLLETHGVTDACE